MTTEQVDYGKRVLNMVEAESYPQLYVHDGFWLKPMTQIGGIWCGGDRDDRVNPIGYQIMGQIFTTHAGAERDLRACQTIAEVRRMADWVDSSDPDQEFTAVYYVVDPGGRFYAEKFRKSEWPMLGSIKFASFESCENCIDTIGQTRLCAIYESGRSL